MPELDLERIVEKNRFTISVLFPFVGAIGFIASAEGLLPGFLAFNPFLIFFGTLVMRLPLVAGLKPLVDRKVGGMILALSLYTYMIEYVGLKTGWPYGSFEYQVHLGPMINGVPLGLPLFFIPLVLNSYLLVNLFRVNGKLKRFLATLGLIVLIDLVLDPAAVALGIWTYGEGVFYGVPASNFLGWLLSGTVAVLFMEAGFNRKELLDRLMEEDYILDDMVSFVLLWGLVNLYYGNIVSVGVSFFFATVLYDADRFNFASPG
ncbi:MAG: bisanhydrobacterioruberin hydratase [Candidatus Nanosalina sp.]